MTKGLSGAKDLNGFLCDVNDCSSGLNDRLRYQNIADKVKRTGRVSVIQPLLGATMHLATQLLQSRYEEIIVRKEMETDAVPDFDSQMTGYAIKI
jgi:hypothetical protein